MANFIQLYCSINVKKKISNSMECSFPFLQLLLKCSQFFLPCSNGVDHIVIEWFVFKRTLKIVYFHPHFHGKEHISLDQVAHGPILALNTSRNGASTTSLGNLFQCLILCGISSPLQITFQQCFMRVFFSFSNTCLVFFVRQRCHLVADRWKLYQTVLILVEKRSQFFSNISSIVCPTIIH